MPYIIIVVLLIIQAILVLAHFLLYKTLIAVFVISNQPALSTVKIILAVLAVSFVLSSVLTFRYYNLGSRLLYLISAVWLGFFLYLFFAACLYWLVVLIGNFFSIPIDIYIIGKVFLILALLTGIYGVINQQTLTVKSIKVQVPNLPIEWNNKKIIWVSDIHLGQIYGAQFMNKISDRILSIKPDVIFVGGDVYDGEAFPISDSVPMLAKLQAPQGVYFITGNHEEFGDDAKYLSAIKEAGIRVLNDELVDIAGVQVIGVDYKNSSDTNNYGKIIDNLKLNSNQPSILLKHAPTDLEIAAKAGINLQISGHTHKAQMWPLNLISYLVYKGYDYGLYKIGNMNLYTSSGVGTWGPPLRVGSHSEIVLIELE